MKWTDEVKQALESATPGPWGWSKSTTTCSLGECVRFSLFHTNDDEMEMKVEDYRIASAAPTWLSKLLTEREEMLKTLRDIAGSCFAQDVPNNTLLWRWYNEFIQKSEATLKQVGELE